jgi:thiol:disulfide interchange protein DsbD
MKKYLCAGLLLLSSVLAFAAPQQPDPLPADQAFRMSVKLFGDDTVVVDWKMAPHHYLYRDRIHFKILQPTGKEIGHVISPPGEMKYDPLLGNYEVYRDRVSLTVPLINPDIYHTILEISYQGCSEQGYCYPPVSYKIGINFSGRGIGYIPDLDQTPLSSLTASSQQQGFIHLITGHHLPVVLLLFFGFGVLLSLTPCVLPMVPILSGIILGHEKTVLRGKAFRLSLVYVLSMAITYAAGGVLAGWAGSSMQVLFQQTWLLVLSSVIFALLALSFFGLYSLKLPAKFEERISHLIGHQHKGHYAGVAIMGCLATLIVSPCVSPALVGILGYIGQTGDALTGGISLFAMGLGMGVPLLIVGLLGRQFLPKAGPWMKSVEYIFGVIFLGMAIWMLSRVVPASITLLLWGILAIIVGVYVGALSRNIQAGWKKLWQGLGLILVVYGVLMLIGAAKGNGNPLQPLASPNHHVAAAKTSSIITIKTLAELQEVLAHTPLSKPVLVDFYADWCVSCKSMEWNVYSLYAVQQALSRFTLIRADITADGTARQELMRSYNVIAPPTFLVFDRNAQLQPNLTRTGEMDEMEFMSYLKQIESTIAQ